MLSGAGMAVWQIPCEQNMTTRAVHDGITRRELLLLVGQSRELLRFRSEAAWVRIGARVLMDGRTVAGLVVTEKWPFC
jgi:hypothetical protein